MSLLEMIAAKQAAKNNKPATTNNNNNDTYYCRCCGIRHDTKKGCDNPYNR